MRIGMMADVYKPRVSGITHYISLNKRYLEEKGHQVFVFTFGNLDYPDDEANIIRSPGLPLVDTGYFLSFRYAPEAKKLLQSMDVVHVHHPFLSGSLALRYCRPLRIPVVFTNHTRYDLYMQAYFPILPDAFGETFLEAYLPSFCRAVDLVISPSQSVADILGKIGITSPVKVIPNGVDLKHFKGNIQPCARSEFNFDPEDVVLIYTGRLAPEKNLPFLLRAFSGVAETYPYVRLVLVGVGPDQDTLKDIVVNNPRLKGRVFFTGMVAYQDIPSYLAMSDGFVTTSVTEVHPLSVIEAMASGLPILGINSPGVGDIVEDGHNGLLSSDDLAAFTAKMSLFVSQPKLRKALAKEACDHADRYAIERTSQLVMEQYQLLVSQASRRQNGFRYFVRSFWERWR